MADAADTGPAELPTNGHRLLRRFDRAVLAFGDRRADVRFVIDGASGLLVLPVEPQVFRHTEVVLALPDESACELQLVGAPLRIERPEAEEVCDRWAAYHGRTTLAAWTRLSIEGAKSPSAVWDGEELTRPNPLRGVEWRLLKPLNADPRALARACERVAKATVPQPVAVGIDPFGIDIRARFGIIRLEFDAEAATPEAAQDALRALLETPG